MNRVLFFNFADFFNQKQKITFYEDIFYPRMNLFTIPAKCSCSQIWDSEKNIMDRFFKFIKKG